MPTLVHDTPEAALPQSPPRKRWTREQCAALEASGVWDDERLELVGGELISKMGKNGPDVTSLGLMLIWLQGVFGGTFVLQESPIDVSTADNPTSEPQPDVVVFGRDFTTIVSGNPQPRDIVLAVEISDTTLRFDRTTKAALYARAGIPEYWILDVSGRRLFVHRNPAAGAYTEIAIYCEDEPVHPLAARRRRVSRFPSPAAPLSGPSRTAVAAAALGSIPGSCWG